MRKRIISPAQLHDMKNVDWQAVGVGIELKAWFTLVYQCPKCFAYRKTVQ